MRGDELFEANGRADSSYRNRPVDFGGQWGYYGDSETGLTLLGHRYYDSYAGRFLTRDPIGYNGGVNLYSYTANDYENEVDPGGTSALALALSQGFQIASKAAAAEEAAGGGPENPFADYAAFLTLTTVLTYQTSSVLSDVYIRPQDGLAAPHVFPRANTRKPTFVCAGSYEKRQISDLLKRRGRDPAHGDDRARLHERIGEENFRGGKGGRRQARLSQDVLEGLADELFGTPEEAAARKAAENAPDLGLEAEIVEDLLNE